MNKAEESTLTVTGSPDSFGKNRTETTLKQRVVATGSDRTFRKERAIIKVRKEKRLDEGVALYLPFFI